jgi:hypothetical protein
MAPSKLLSLHLASSVKQQEQQQQRQAAASSTEHYEELDRALHDAS